MKKTADSQLVRLVSAPTQRAAICMEVTAVPGCGERKLRWLLSWDTISSVQPELNEVATATWGG